MEVKIANYCAMPFEINWYLTLQHFEVTTNTNKIYRIKQNWEFSWITVSSGKQAGAEFGQAQPNW